MIRCRVTHYNPDEAYGFAFIQEEKKSVFFHKSFGGKYIVKDDGLVGMKTGSEKDPKTGDLLLVEAEAGPKGLRATFWAFVSDCEELIALLEEKPLFRLIRRDGYANRKYRSQLHSDIDAKHYIMWEGRNISALEKTAPMDAFPIMDTETKGIFFKINKNGEWVDYDGKDPRSFLRQHKAVAA